MSNLSPLIRLSRHTLDEKRRALAALYRALEAKIAERHVLEQTYAREKEAVRKSGDVHFTIAQYAEKVRAKKKELEKAEAEIERQIAEAKDSLMETFAEMKKYELTKAQRERLEAEERKFKESLELDAVGIEGFRRKKDADAE